METKNQEKKLSKKIKVIFFSIWIALVLAFVIIPAQDYQEISVFGSTVYAALLGLSALVLTVIVSVFVDLE